MDHVVLVVDDDVDTCRSVRDLLELVMPATVHIAPSVAIARKILEELSIDLVIVDYLISGENTIQFVREIQANRTPRVFLYTAIPFLPPRIGVRVLQKSLGPDALIAAVAEHLAKRRRR